MAKNNPSSSTHDPVRVRINSGKGASGCLFLLLISSQALSSSNSSPNNETCSSGHYDETAIVSSIHDGDTVRLKDGRKIRLIGINTPELARDDMPAQAFAIEARNRLSQQLRQHNNTVQLVFGKEHKDRYKRTLAHLFLPDGHNLQADLLAQGLATANTHPPNDTFSDCYHRIEKNARCQSAGIWSQQAYSIKNSLNLDKAASGFHILKARVLRVSVTDKSAHLFLDGGILAGIKSASIQYFDKNWLKSLTNRFIIIQGWLHAKKNVKNDVLFYMQIKHPSAIHFLGEKDKKSAKNDCQQEE